jgi:putative membrane protein
VSARFLDDAARAAFARAVDAIETVSAVEVVVAVRRRSYAYRHVNTTIGILVAFAGLAAMLFSSYTFSLVAILFDPFAVGLAAGALVELLPGLKRVLTPHLQRRLHVHRAARATFFDRGVHATRDRSGLLVYISWLEQEVALVPDLGLQRALPAETLLRMEQALSAEMKHGGAAVATALEKLCNQLRDAMPIGGDDTDELSNSIDSDLGRRLFRRRAKAPPP